MLKFSRANAKIEALKNVPSIAEYLQNGKKVYSLDLLSGWSCPGASECLSKVRVNALGKRTIHDGPSTQFRCFSASQEVVFTNLFNLRKYNFDTIRAVSDCVTKCTDILLESIPNDLGVCRIHVAGDFFNENYMWAWGNVALTHPDKLFYAYTKSLNYWVDSQDWFANIPNLVLTASYGSRFDAYIRLYGLRSAKVVFHPSETSLDIDHDDSHAADPTKRDQDFALLLHGTQPKDTEAAKSLRILNQEGIKYAYGR